MKHTVCHMFIHIINWFINQQNVQTRILFNGKKHLENIDVVNKILFTIYLNIHPNNTLLIHLFSRGIYKEKLLQHLFSSKFSQLFKNHVKCCASFY